jgi:hypothetical protein
MQLKNLFSTVLYLSAAELAYVSIHISYFIYVLIPALYFLPEKNSPPSDGRHRRMLAGGESDFQIGVYPPPPGLLES